MDWSSANKTSHTNHCHPCRWSHEHNLRAPWPDSWAELRVFGPAWPAPIAEASRIAPLTKEPRIASTHVWNDIPNNPRTQSFLGGCKMYLIFALMDVPSGEWAFWVADVHREPGILSCLHLAVEEPFSTQFSVRNLETVDARPGDWGSANWERMRFSRWSGTHSCARLFELTLNISWIWHELSG